MLPCGFDGFAGRDLFYCSNFGNAYVSAVLSAEEN